MTTAAIIPHFARPHLMPCLSHRQHESILVEHLEGERGIGGDFGHETCIGIAFRVENGSTVGVEFSQGYLTQYPQALAGVTDKMVSIIVRTAGVRAVA